MRDAAVAHRSTPVRRSVNAALVFFLAVLGGVSAWVVVPIAQTASDGTATPVEAWIDGLVPLLSALAALGVAAALGGESGREAALPLIPFAVVAVVWTLTSGLQSGSDVLYGLCLIGMPISAIGGGFFSAAGLRAQRG